MSTVLVVATAVPLGVLLSRPAARRFTPVAMGLAAPVIGVIVLLAMAWGFGFRVAVLALSLYAFLPVLANTLRIMARNNRLFAVPELVRSLKSLVAEARGEVTAEVVSAAPLTQEQERRLTETLAQKSGKTVKLDARVDDTLIGGMIVKLGSQMIDSSIRSKLASLQNVLKEVR